MRPPARVKEHYFAKALIAFVLILAGTREAKGQHAVVEPESLRSRRTYLDSLLQSQNTSSAARSNIIVEFTDEPMFPGRVTSSGLRPKFSPQHYQSLFSRFISDVDALTSATRTSTTDRLAIRHRYYKVFFGVSATVPSWMLPTIQHLGYVKAIHNDGEVHATIDPAVELIGAPAVWQSFGTQGEGIRIGIIDTGIDYLHPALGGGFGPGFKVAGGYDVVNNDPDPLDDNGHGTHVAGIVAASSDSVTGVAPLATLFAFKALDATGRGVDSDILEAIERTVDPNQDNDDEDRLDVVNMSLGSDVGSPTDPTSIAVDNAIGLGVVFCVAAGNTGGRTPVQGKEENYFYDGSGTIGSPGTAELAITVGAAVNVDTLARFSSKGPNRASFSIKPEVVAPGVEINSTYPGSTYKVLSGTSMATPMVTGVAALIKSLHPSWSPAFIKSAIVNKAKDLGISRFRQGGGRVRAVEGVSARTLIAPSTLSYGLDDPVPSLWISPETLRVYNNDTLPQSYSATTLGTAPGISLIVTPSNFSIPANDSLMVVVTLTVNNTQIVVVDEDILRFSGSVIFNGSADTANVPWGFVRTNMLTITTSEAGAYFIAYSPAGFIASTSGSVNWTSPTRAEFYAPVKGTYEFFTVFRNPAGVSRIVINEGVSVATDAAAYFLDAAQAVHPLVFSGVDHLGDPIAGYRSPQRSLVASLPNFGDWTTTLRGGSDTLLISPVANNHSFKPIEFQVDLANSMTIHTIPFDKFTGMNGPKTAVNSSSNFIQQHVRVKVPPGTPGAANVTQVWSYADVNGAGQYSGLGLDVDTVSVDNDQYAFTAYLGKSPIPTQDIALKFYTSYSDVHNYSLDYESPFILTYHDSVVATSRELVTPAIPRFESGATMTLGGAPAHVLGLWYNNTFGANTLHFQTIFRGMMEETRYADAVAGTYSVYDKHGALLLSKGLNEPRTPLQLTADTFRVDVSSSNYWLRNAKGSVSLSSTFNLGVGLPANPPSVTSFMLLDSNGHPTDAFRQGDRARLQCSFNVINFSDNALPIVDSTRAWYRKHGTLPWTPLLLSEIAEAVANEGIIMQGDLSSALLEDSAAFDVKVAAKGVNGFSMEQVVAPAFAVGNWNPITTVPNPPSGGIPHVFALEQNYPNPFNPSTVITYELPAAAQVTLKIYDVLGREVKTLVDEKRNAGKHSLSWNASGMSSGVYFYRLQAGTLAVTKKLLLVR